MVCYRRVAVAAAVFVAVAGAAVAGPAPTQTSKSGDPSSTRLLDVPYLPQTADLCGGAAVAMVLRYWGERQVYAEDFAPLVDRSAAGIATDVLTREVSRRGWQTHRLEVASSASDEWIRDNVDRGRPIIALIEVSPGRYHYVVVVAWTAERVILHDPAREPFRLMSRGEFDRVWALAGHWALLVLPSPDRPSAQAATLVSRLDDRSPPPNPCAGLVREMVARSHTGDVAGADAGLGEAVALCPQDAEAWRELAGIRFLQSRWADASRLATHAMELDPGDAPGWDLLATSRFLNDQPEAALAAWNRIDRPAVDVVRVEGALRTRRPVVAAVMKLPARTILTPELFAHAARRLRELPSAAQTRLSYRPLDHGLADVEAVVVEHKLPSGFAPIFALVGRTWLQREVRVDVAAPTGSGEMWTAAWRWWEKRPRIAFALAAPAPGRLPGVVRVEGSWEQQSYAVTDRDGISPAIVRTERRRAAMSLADWANSWLRWQAGAALDRFADDERVSLSAAADLRFAGDRISIGADTAAWAPTGSGRRFVSGGLSSAWRSTRESSRPLWQASAGLTVTSAGAPFDVWPGAGADDARVPLLRAHPLLDHGVLSGTVFGRYLAHSTLEYQYPVLSAHVPGIWVATFTDLARAWRLVDGADSSPLHVDVGAGVRVGLPGGGGTARFDVARGLRDGAVALSVGWQTPWPRH